MSLDADIETARELCARIVLPIIDFMDPGVELSSEECEDWATCVADVYRQMTGCEIEDSEDDDSDSDGDGDGDGDNDSDGGGGEGGAADRGGLGGKDVDADGDDDGDDSLGGGKKMDESHSEAKESKGGDDGDDGDNDSDGARAAAAAEAKAKAKATARATRQFAVTALRTRGVLQLEFAVSRLYETLSELIDQRSICLVCKGTDSGDLLLLCDRCDNATHTFCCDPPLDEPPAGEWLCCVCKPTRTRTRPSRRTVMNVSPPRTHSSRSARASTGGGRSGGSSSRADRNSARQRGRGHRSAYRSYSDDDDDDDDDDRSSSSSSSSSSRGRRRSGRRRSSGGKKRKHGKSSSSRRRHGRSKPSKSRKRRRRSMSSSSASMSAAQSESNSDPEIIMGRQIAGRGHGGGSSSRNHKRAKPSSHNHRGNSVDVDAQSDDLSDDTLCATCAAQDDPDLMILCDSCDAGTHVYCHMPPLEKVPSGDWHCPDCRVAAPGACQACGVTDGRPTATCEICDVAWHRNCCNERRAPAIDRGGWCCAECRPRSGKR
jgi:hypothetical protein